jgi:hypothetical protein
MNNPVGQAVPDASPMANALRRRGQAQPDLRALLAALMSVAFSTTSAAGVRHIEDEENTGHTTIQMEVTPADEPSPAFEHRLTYGIQERLPGNRPQWYARAYPEETRAWSAWNKLTSGDDFEAYYTSGTPIDEVAWDKLDRLGRELSRSLVDDHIVTGAMRRDCDWGIRSEQFSIPELFTFLLPEFQSSRSLARMLNLQVRLALHERRYDDAVKYLRTEYQLGADTGQEPLIICGLVGVAISSIANAGVADLIAAPDSPNLYWALSEIPAIPVPIGPAVRNELAFSQKIFGELSELDQSKRTPDEWNASWKSSVAKIYGAIGNVFDEKSHAVAVTAVPAATGLYGYSHAKQRLIDWGRTPAEVEAMAVGQVLTLYAARISRTGADKYWQAFIAPYSAMKFRDGSAAEKYVEAGGMLSGGDDRELLPIVSLLGPATHSARTAEMRVARDLAALRVIEALRMHAARNDSRWPDALDDVRCVPMPLNPATDKPFLYHRDGETAVLELPDTEGFPGYSRRYEITIAKP